MDRAVVDGITLEYEIAGTGEPVVLIHGALIADSFRPLLVEPVLAHRYKLIVYHRRGYMGSSHTPGPVSIVRQAADCLALLRHLGVERAHIVGHSYGGAIALQLTLDTQNVVHSLALLEPALIVGATGQSYRDALALGQQRYRERTAAVVVDKFLQARFGAGYRTALDQVVPGAFTQAVADATTWFKLEIAAFLDWSFGEAEARRITQPVLVVLGSESNALWPRFGETSRLLRTWLPDAKGFVLPGAAHGLQMQNPHGMAEALADFYARHPIPGPN
ncbi:MAG: alpha/beta hydrolase [Chloroflexi bacterium]|nr:alpha/beta hydrolase [Chloroflexota bacterium]